MKKEITGKAVSFVCVVIKPAMCIQAHEETHIVTHAHV